jgi:hypothetical protein
MRTTCRWSAFAVLLVFATLWAGPWAGSGGAGARNLTADPATYQDLVSRLQPGDRLSLVAGRYLDGLTLKDLDGQPGHPIVIEGPQDRSAIFVGKPGRNTVELRRVSHLELRNLTLDGLNTPGIDGVKAHAVTHHITLDNLAIVNHASHQQSVGISTKAAAWNWVIRNSIISGAGTGLYLGNSDGSAPFVQGVIENNQISSTIGYGLQIKHQTVRSQISGMPQIPGSTVIRYNVISKARQPVAGFQGPRPNLLVGHFPSSGAGTEDLYEIYGNLLYQNRVNEPLFQGEGNIAFHDNLLVNDHGDAIWIQPHNDRPRRVMVFHNTIVAKGAGIVIRQGLHGFRQQVIGNAVFAAQPLAGGEQEDNFTAAYEAAAEHLRAPNGDWRTIDLRPLPDRLVSAASGTLPFLGLAGADRDFADNPRDGRHIGAYAGPDVPKDGPLASPARR